MKSLRFILALILAATGLPNLMAQTNPAAKLVGHWLNRELFEYEDGDQETHTYIHRQPEGALLLNIFTIAHADKTSTLEVKHGRWVLAGDAYTETFPATEETDHYGVVAITDTDFRYTYLDEDDNVVELLDELISVQRFVPPLLPSGYQEVNYNLWGKPAPPVVAKPVAAETSNEPAQSRRQMMATAIMNNLRQLAAATEQYFIETGAKKAAYTDLIGPDKYIDRLTSFDGEDYSKLEFSDTVGAWIVTTKSGVVVSYDRFTGAREIRRVE